MLVKKDVNNLSKLNYAIFDFDGTIIDSEEGIVYCILKTLSYYKIPLSKDRKIRKIIGPSITEVLEKIIPKNKKYMIPRLVEKFRFFYGKDGIHNATIYEKIPELLKLLKNKNVRMYIVTNKPLIYTRFLCKKFDIEIFFNSIIGTQINGKSKSKDRMIKSLKDKHTIDVNNTCFIGDTSSDIYLAKKHKIYSIGVLYGHGNRQDLIKSNPDLLISSISDLIRFVQRYGQS